MRDTHVREDLQPLDVRCSLDLQDLDLSKSLADEDPSFQSVIFAWEKLRLLYNLILTGATLAILGWGFVSHFPRLVECALYANISFCAGPAAEGYICLALGGKQRKTIRLIVFILGTILALVGVFAVLTGLVAWPGLQMPDR